MRRRTAAASVAAVLVGAGIAVGAPLMWAGSNAPAERSFGNGVATQLARQQPATEGLSQRQPQPGRIAATTVLPRVSTTARTGRLPKQLSIAQLGINAPVVPVGIDPSGSVAIPADVRTVGWYRWSAPPGSTSGSTVIVGHVDSAQQGAGAFFRLHTVEVGDRVSLTTQTRTYEYRVVARQNYAKATAPLTDFFATNGAPRLTLITCGGSFDARYAKYRDNVVVTAVPIEDPREGVIP